jgi:hypothetical protein
LHKMHNYSVSALCFPKKKKKDARSHVRTYYSASEKTNPKRFVKGKKDIFPL